MFKLQKPTLIVLLLLAGLSLACSLTDYLDQAARVPGEPSGDAVATAVAATLAASGSEPVPSTEMAGPTPSFTIHPTITASPDYTYQGVSFSYINGVVSGAVPEEVPAQTEGPFSHPAFLEFMLDGYPMPGGYFDPQVRVFPVAEYRAVNEYAGESIDALQTLIDTQPADPDSIPVPDFGGAAQFIGCQKEYLAFQNGSGVRYVTQWGQAAYPIGFPQMFYSFQGLTEDGAYYVHVVFSVGHPSLPDAESVTMDENFYNNYQTYTAEKEAELDAQAPASFQPSLLLLDQLVSSIRVDAP